MIDQPDKNFVIIADTEPVGNDPFSFDPFLFAIHKYRINNHSDQQQQQDQSANAEPGREKITQHKHRRRGTGDVVDDAVQIE